MFFGSGRYNQNFLQNTETGLSTYEVVIKETLDTIRLDRTITIISKVSL